MDFIQKSPLKCQLKYKNIRIKFLKKLDVGINYIIENQTVIILAVSICDKIVMIGSS